MKFENAIKSLGWIVVGLLHRSRCFNLRTRDRQGNVHVLLKERNKIWDSENVQVNRKINPSKGDIKSVNSRFEMCITKQENHPSKILQNRCKNAAVSFVLKLRIIECFLGPCYGEMEGYRTTTISLNYNNIVNACYIV